MGTRGGFRAGPRRRRGQAKVPDRAPISLSPVSVLLISVGLWAIVAGSTVRRSTRRSRLTLGSAPRRTPGRFPSLPFQSAILRLHRVVGNRALAGLLGSSAAVAPVVQRD